MTGFDPMKREPWLSPATCMGGTLIPSSERRDLIQTACRLQSDKAIYSALVLDKAMVFVPGIAMRMRHWLTGRSIQFGTVD